MSELPCMVQSGQDTPAPPLLRPAAAAGYLGQTEGKMRYWIVLVVLIVQRLIHPEGQP